jgi:hypothetical protein
MRKSDHRARRARDPVRRAPHQVPTNKKAVFVGNGLANNALVVRVIRRGRNLKKEKSPGNIIKSPVSYFGNWRGFDLADGKLPKKESLKFT